MGAFFVTVRLIRSKGKSAFGRFGVCKTCLYETACNCEAHKTVTVIFVGRGSSGSGIALAVSANRDRKALNKSEGVQ